MDNYTTYNWAPFTTTYCHDNNDATVEDIFAMLY